MEFGVATAFGSGGGVTGFARAAWMLRLSSTA
jgi:hypothetical protein